MPLVALLILGFGQQRTVFARGSSLDETVVLRNMGTDRQGFMRLSDAVASAVYWDDSLEKMDREASNPQARLANLGRRLRFVADEVQKRENAPRSALLRQ